MDRSLAVLLLVLSACAPGETPDPSPQGSPSPAARAAAPAAVTTDRLSYALEHGPFGPETTIRTTFTAPPDETAYIANCNGAINTGLQRLVDGRWTNVWAVEMNGCFSAPIVIPPGGQHSVAMTVDSAAEAFVHSRRREDRIDSGTYRVVWHGVFTTFDMRANPPGDELPLELRVSAPITIRAAVPFDPSRPSPERRPEEFIFIEPDHGSAADPDAKLNARLSFVRAEIRLAGIPRLYVDGDDVTDRARIVATESAPPTAADITYDPGRWSTGLHQVRVVYRDEDGRMHWYAWSFTVE